MYEKSSNSAVVFSRSYFFHIFSERVFEIVANFMPHGKCDVFVSIRFALHRISCLSDR